MKDVCADCGKADPSWTSINRGLLLCQDCCSVHRSIGRHVSWVRCLQQGFWNPTLLMMIETLNKAGANSIWEYNLLDQTASPTSCKPLSTNVSLTAKDEFIRAKHEELQYVLKSEQEVDGPEGLSAQLHAAARTPDLVTSLRLISQGADPNFYHEEKGSTPLHVAAKTGQGLQVELLVVHGSDLERRDVAGRTPEEAARDAGHLSIAERLRNCRYQAIDRLAQYLCSRRPGQSSTLLAFISGLDAIKGSEGEGVSKEGRNRLQALSNAQFEKLVADVYDEIDRREASAAWIGASDGAAGVGKTDPVLFLPVHPELSATRNQGRQKLARLSLRDFDTLIRDILLDSRRRDSSLNVVNQKSSPITGNKLRTDISDDEPLYDSVASDEDYASTNGELRAVPNQPISGNQSLPTQLNVKQSQLCSEPTNQPQTAVLSSSQSDFVLTNHISEDNSDMRRSLATSAATIARLQSEIQMLQDKVVGLMRENRDLRDEMTRSQSFGRNSECDDEATVPKLRGLRPTSMYEARDRLRNWNGKVVMRSDESQNQQQKTNAWPEYQRVIQKTDLVTKRIQELCVAMRGPELGSFMPCALRIRGAVTELSSLFPPNLADPLLGNLAVGVSRLEMECTTMQRCPPSAHAHCIQSIRNAAYEIAKATKQLVVKCSDSNC